MKGLGSKEQLTGRLVFVGHGASCLGVAEALTAKVLGFKLVAGSELRFLAFDHSQTHQEYEV